MTNGEFYDHSVVVNNARNSLIELNTQLAKSWLFRHSLLVNASPKGLACHYARQAMTYSLEEREMSTLAKQFRTAAAVLTAVAERLEHGQQSGFTNCS